MTEPATHRSQDLTLRKPPVLRWTDESGLGEVHEWAEQAAHDAIDGYLAEKKRKARWSRGLRASATAGRPALGNGGFVMLALAAGCLAHDRFFGYSSSWLRDVAAATKLRAQVNDFRIAWLRETIPRSDRNDPAPGKSRSLVDLIHQFVLAVHDTIRQETDSWPAEFHTHMAEQESQLTGPQLSPTRAKAENGGLGSARI